MAEGAPLLREYVGKTCIEGSNPSGSAKRHCDKAPLGLFSRPSFAMSLSSVRAFLAEKAPDLEVLVMPTSTATVALAAESHGVAPGQIAKTLSLELGGEVILLVMSGDARIDNRKYKERFGAKARLLATVAVLEATGHPVGGVCPFGLVRPLRVYADESLRAFDVVVPAAGDTHAAVRLEPQRLVQLAAAEWVDVAQT